MLEETCINLCLMQVQITVVVFNWHRNVSTKAGKTGNVKFNESAVTDAGVVPCGQTDGQWYRSGEADRSIFTTFLCQNYWWF